MKRYPSIDLGLCCDCRGCIEIAPGVFRHNSATGLMEVIECTLYPIDLVDEAIKNCPEDCIFWESDKKHTPVLDEADEIIIGIERKSKVGKILFGSTAQKVILEAECSVVTNNQLIVIVLSFSRF